MLANVGASNSALLLSSGHKNVSPLLIKAPTGGLTDASNRAFYANSTNLWNFTFVDALFSIGHGPG